MNKLLIPYCDFHIYIIEQSDDGELFNIGKLKNIGFEIANKDYKYDNYIFSDIDTIPDYNLIKYYCEKLKYPISLALRGTRYTKNINEKENKQMNKETNKQTNKQKIFLGALLGFNDKQFKKINGYPNNFWGWGGEDEALKSRLVNSGIGTFYYPINGSIIDMEETKEMKTINTVHNKLKNEKKEEVKYEKLNEDLTSWKNNGLSNLNYKVLDTKKINTKTTQIKVDLMKKEDEKDNPHLYEFKNNSNYKKLMNIVRNTVNKIKYEFI